MTSSPIPIPSRFFPSEKFETGSNACNRSPQLNRSSDEKHRERERERDARPTVLIHYQGLDEDCRENPQKFCLEKGKVSHEYGD